MSDLQKRFEAWLEAEFGMWAIPVSGKYKSRQTQAMWEAWQAALQSQTAPAVPDGWELRKVEAEETTISVHRNSDGRWCAGGQLGAYGRHGLLFEFFDAMLAAAPKPDPATVKDSLTVDHIGGANKMGGIQSFKAFHAALCRRFGYTHDEQFWWRDLVSLEEHIASQVQPDHSPDAGKVVQEPAGIACVGYGETVGQTGFTQYVRVKNLIPEGTKLYTHPAESREEIQAQALDGQADRLEHICQSFTREYQQGYVSAARELRNEAARLRASQQEGGDA